MDFTMGSIEEAKVAAIAADTVRGKYVEEPGAYVGQIEEMRFIKYNSGAAKIRIKSKTKDINDMELNMSVDLWTLSKGGVPTDKYGNTNKGINLIRGGLIPITNGKSFNSVELEKKKYSSKASAEERIYPMAEGINIGFLINIVLKDGQKEGQVYKEAELVTFYDPKTNKTGSEIVNKTEAKKKVKIEFGLEIIDKTTKCVSNGFSGSDEDVDPFTKDEGVDPFTKDDTSDDSEVKDNFFDDVDDTEDEGVDSE